MSFTTKSRLLALMDTMTASEKRYIRQFVNKSGETKSNHIQLFEAIARQDTYDEVKLKKKFRGTSIGKQWSRVKNYLYNYILRVLQNYHQQDAAFEIFNMIQQITILYNKGIYEEAQKLLTKVKTLAFGGVYPSLLPFIAEWEMKLEMVDDTKKVGTRSINNEKNNKWAIEIAENALVYYRHQKDITENSLQKQCLTKDVTNLKMLDRPMYTSVNNAKSPATKLMFHRTKCFLYTEGGQFEEAYNEAKKQLEIHQENPLLQKQDPLGYVVSMKGFVTNAIETRQWDQIPLVMKKIDLFIQNNKVTYINVLVTSIKYIALLKTCMGTMEFEKGLQYKLEIEQFIEANKKYSDRYVQANLLRHYLVQIHVISGQYEAALEMIEKVEQVQKTPISLNAILLLKLICMYEEEAFFLLPYAIRSVYRKLLKGNRLREFERVVLNVLKAGMNAASKSELQIIFQRYWLQLKDLISTTPIAKLELLEHFNYLAWMESKIKGIPLMKLLKNNPPVVAIAG